LWGREESTAAASKQQAVFFFREMRVQANDSGTIESGQSEANGEAAQMSNRGRDGAGCAREGSIQIRRGFGYAGIRQAFGCAVGIAGIAFCFLLAQVPLHAQQTTFHVDVKLVNIFVNVTDKNGAIVGSLTRNDFAVFEDNRPQQIAFFDRESAMPLNLTLAIDTSGSVRKDMSMEESAARHFAQAILRPQDQMSLVQFATDVHELTPFTNKISVIERGLSQLHGDWATALYDAVCFGSEHLGGKQGRKVMVVVSDGDDTAQHSTYADALEQALRNEVMIYSIIDVPIEASAGRDTGGEHALITLAEETGGKHFYVSDGGLDKAFARVSDDLRTQYVLGYYPRNQEPGKDFHRIVVTIPRAAADEFNVRNKAGYYADATVRGN
jgi:Ca-activated chloride channel homolog